MKIPQERQGSLGQYYIELESDIIAAILRTIQQGWRLASIAPPVSSNAGEVPINECLRDGMRTALENLPWKGSMFILPGTESRSAKSLLVPDGLTDISILIIKIARTYSVHDPQAIIECKRISGSDTDLCRAYVLEGVDRFASGKYAASHDSGFMVGYLLSQDEQSAADGINKVLNRRLRSNEGLSPSNVIQEDCFWSSRHSRRDRLPSINLHHSFLSLQSWPP